MLRAVIFDLDDTLFDWSKRVGNWQLDASRRLHRIYAHLANAGHSLPPLEWFTRVYIECATDAWGDAEPPEWRAPHLGDILTAAIRQVGVPAAAAIAREDLLDLYLWDLPEGVEPYPEAPETLRALRRAGLRLGLLTNSALPMRLRDVELEAFGLKDLFDARASAADIGRLKPHPEAFGHVLKRLGIAAREAVFVGDAPLWDIAGAQDAGMRAVWRRSPERELDHVRPDATINFLDELLPLFDLWYPNWRDNA